MHVTDLEGNEYPLQATTTNDYELNGNQSLSFKILPNKVNNQFIENITEMWTVTDHDDVEYKIVYLKKQGFGDSLTVNVKAVPKFFDEFDTKRIYDEHNGSMTALACFKLIFGDTNYYFILNDSFNAVEWEGLGAGETKLESFKRALNRYKAEFRISGNTVYIEKQIGRDTQFMYRYRLNASNIVQENDASNYWTYARGYGDYDGADGWENANLIREYTSPIADIIGIREAPPIKNGNITKKSTMDDQLKTLVDESLKISVSATIHDLRKQGYALAQPETGDRVFLIDERIGLNAEVRVVDLSIVRDWKGNVIDLSLTFGTHGLVKRHQSNLQTSIDNITNLLEGNIKLPFSVLDNAVAEATKALQDAQTELSFSDNGILAVDKNNPNLVTLFNSAGLGVSDDGGATFKNAITGRGINASVIYTGTMLADRIAGGILSSLNGGTEFNLNDGHLSMNSTLFELGGSAEIELLDSRNKIVYQKYDPESGFSRTAGVGLSNSINNRFPVIYLGATGTGKGSFGALDDNYFSGFVANTTKREETDGIGNSVVGYRFHVRDKAVSYSKGWEFNLNGSVLAFRPFNAHLYDYKLGEDNNRLNEGYIRTIYGTLAGTSTHNAKMNIEDIDSQKAFDYFDQMKIKSFYYKNEDYTNPYNKKVSPIIEQLDPTLENLFKANDESLDINSNLFLLASAFQHFVSNVNKRLEVLEGE